MDTTAALVDRMGDSSYRHDIDALAACYATGGQGQRRRLAGRLGQVVAGPGSRLKAARAHR
jgi:hypothetical protein